LDFGDVKRGRPACPFALERKGEHRKGCECFKPELIEGIMTSNKLPPIHPGKILQEHFFEPRNLTIKKVAQDINIPVYQLEDLIKEKGRIDTDMACRLAYYFQVGAEQEEEVKKQIRPYHQAEPKRAKRDFIKKGLDRAIQERAKAEMVLLFSTNHFPYLQQIFGKTLKPLKGGRKGEYRIKVDNQYRICFK
ncbi:16061_t:CDS:2, partial [Funneliformis geosporum]